MKPTDLSAKEFNPIDLRIIDREVLEDYFGIFNTEAQTRLLELLPTLDMPMEHKLNYIDDNFGEYIEIQIKKAGCADIIFVGMFKDGKEAILKGIAKNTDFVDYTDISLTELCMRFGLKLQYI